MPSMGHAVFRGKSGQTYRFKVYPLGTKLRPLSGIYLVTNRCRNKQGGYQYITLYVGATNDLSQPIAEHPKASDFKRHGANSICLQSDNSEESRIAKQVDISAALEPACND